MIRYAAQSGERVWTAAQNQDQRNPSSRDLFTYALALCEAKLHPERLAPLLELAARMQDRDPQRRDKLIDRLLSSDAFVDYWTYRFADPFLVNRDSMDARGAMAFSAWRTRRLADARQAA